MTATVSAPSWWAQWGPLVTMYAAEFGVPLNIAAGVIQQESGGNPNAQSYAGANGLMQVVGGSFDPATNIAQGMQILANDLNQWGTTLGLAAYNAGGGNVSTYGMNILNPAYLLSQGWKPIDAYQVSTYVTNVTSLANQYAGINATTKGFILPPLPLPPGSLPPLPGGSPVPGVSPTPGIPTAPGTGTQPALAPIPPPTATGFWPVDAFNSASNTVNNAILSIERFFFIGVGLFLIALGIWLLVKAGDNRGNAPTP